jgi:hypothetical protein
MTLLGLNINLTIRRFLVVDVLTHSMNGLWKTKGMSMVTTIGVWQGVAKDFPKVYPGPPWPTLLCPAGGPPQKRPYSCFWGDLPVEQVPCGHLLPFWTPHAVRLWSPLPKSEDAIHSPSIQLVFREEIKFFSLIRQINNTNLNSQTT